MKNLSYILGIAAALLSLSCTVEEKMEMPTREGYKITLVGSNAIDTKVSIGEKENGVYPLLWSEGDIISIWSKNYAVAGEDVTGNIQGEYAELIAESAGQHSGAFQTQNDFLLEADEEILILYPGDIMKFNNGVITGSVAANQEQRAANSGDHLGQSAFSYGTTTLAANQKEGVTFSLSQKTAFVKVNLSTTEYSSLKLAGVKLSAPGEQLAGKMTATLESGEIAYSSTTDYVGATFRTPVEFTGTQSVYFTALPCNLSGKDVYLFVTMLDESKNSNVTIPVKLNATELKAGHLTVISVENISSSMNTYKWYEPVETRDLLNGWAFGPQNTYYAKAGETLTIDVKARGDISKISGAPKYYGLLLHGTPFTRTLLELPDGTNTVQANPTQLVKDDYTIDVKLSATGNAPWGVVAIYDENYNILWSYFICRYVDGDPVEDVDYGNGIVMMDRVLGQLESIEAGVKAQKFDGNIPYFQWGKKDPILWSISNIANYGDCAKFWNDAAASGVDLAHAIANPGIKHTKGKDLAWYGTAHMPNLWGGGVSSAANSFDTAIKGKKTVYDPCPAGYRVMDPIVAEMVTTQGVVKEVKLTNKYEVWTEGAATTALQKEEYIATTPVLPKYSVIEFTTASGAKDYWPYFGWKNANAAPSYDSRPKNNTCVGGIYWTSAANSAGKRGVAMEYAYYGSARHDGRTRFDQAMAISCLVRCQKETK